MNSDELWTFKYGISFNMKTIKGYPTYNVTKDGRVWSHRSEMWLKPCVGRSGYWQVNLYGKHGLRSVPIHCLVLEAFVCHRPLGKEACHNNGDPHDNHLTNLRWDTRSANATDKVRHGRCTLSRENRNFMPVRGSRVGTARLTDQMVRQMLYVHQTRLFSQREIAAQFGVAQRTVNTVVNKQTWKHIWTV
jgi:hypothetical protein